MKKYVFFALMILSSLPLRAQETPPEGLTITFLPKGTEFIFQREVKIPPQVSKIEIGKLTSGEKCILHLNGSYINQTDYQFIKKDRTYKSIEVKKNYGSVRLGNRNEDWFGVYCEKDIFTIGELKEAIKGTILLNLNYPPAVEFPDKSL